MAWSNDREQLGKRMTQPAVDFDQSHFLARMGRCAGEYRAPPNCVLQQSKGMLVGRGIRYIELEISGGGNAGRSEVAKSGRVGCRLRKAKIKRAQQGCSRSRSPAPALERAFGEPAVGQN
jgi:hypothetical protein